MIRLEFEIRDVEQVNPLFSKCKIYICYSDLNRNNSVISKELINRKISTLYNCPIVGQFSKDNDDFTDHGGKIEITDDGDASYIITTIPYGIVPESSEVKWETVDDKEYLTCTGYLWTSRYPEALLAIEEGRPQSMELAEVSGEWNKDKHFVITDFVFSALCILGKDVEPCFEEAKVVAYSLNKDQFKQEFSQMIEELKFSVKGDEKENLSQSEEYINKNEIDSEGGEQEINMIKVTKKEIAARFNLTHLQLHDELVRVLSSHKFLSDDWYGGKYEISRFWMHDYDENFVYARDRKDNVDVKIPYSRIGDDVELKIDSMSRVKTNFEDWDHGNSTKTFEEDGDDDDDDENKENEENGSEEEKDDDDDSDESEESEDEDFMSKYAIEANLKNIASEAFTVISQEKTSFDNELTAKNQELQDKDNTIFELNAQIEELNSKLKAADAELKNFVEEREKKEKEEREKRESEMFDRYKDKLSEEEMESFREKLNSFSLEEVEDKIKIFLFERITAQPTNFSRDSQRTFMGLPLKKPEDKSGSKSNSVWDRLKN